MHPDCPICLEAIRFTSNDVLDATHLSGDAPRAIPCGHVVCRTCVRLVLTPFCPTCRAPFNNNQIYTLSFQEEAAVHVPPIVYVERYVQDLRRQYASLEETRDDVVEEIDHKARGLTVQRSRVRHYTNLLQTYSEDALTALKKVDVLTGRYEKERARIIALERLRTAINAPTCTPLRRTRSEADAILPPAPKRARFD